MKQHSHSTTYSNDELVDEEILTQMVKDTSADIIPILIEHYIEESDVRLKNIDQALQNKNAEQLEFETHTLGSAALALGNRQLSVIARDIERLCLQHHYEEAFNKVRDLQSVAQTSVKALIARKKLGF